MGSSLVKLSSMTQLLVTFSQFIVCIFLLCLAQGYSIEPSWRTSDQQETMWIGISVMGVVKYLLVWVDRVNDRDHYRFNDYSSSSGVLLIIFRLSLYLYFLYSLQAMATKSPLFRTFKLQLALLGTVYFLQGLFVFLVELLFQPENVLLGIMLIAIGSNYLSLTYLSIMTNSKSNSYDKVKNKIILPMF